jgi:hypothetical protein
MVKFTKKSIPFDPKRNQDDGVNVSELINLIGDNKIGTELLKKMGVDSIKDEFIAIPNAKSLVATQTAINKQYHKVDVDSSLDDISLYSQDGEFSINFGRLERNDYFRSLGISEVNTEPIYSAQRDFFSGLYQMDKYAAQLIEKGLRDIVEMNWERLRQEASIEKRYRILRDMEENKYYLRAIISTRQYHNYDNNIAIIVALLTLHNEMKAGQIEFRLARIEYSESVIRMFFESSERVPLIGIGYVKNYIEVSNDEIKREALRFSGSCSIIFSDGKEEGRIFIQPKEVNSNILTIRHNVRPETANTELAGIANSKEIHSELFKDIVKIKGIKKPETIKLWLQEKIDNARREDIGDSRAGILKILNQPAENILDLLKIFGKIEMFAQEDVGVSEYLRLAIYEILIKRGK